MTQYIRKNEYEVTQLDGEWIILDTEKYTVTTLNEVGGFCWSLLQEIHTVRSLSQAVQEQYQTIEGTVEKDIDDFLSHLVDCGLIQEKN